MTGLSLAWVNFYPEIWDLKVVYLELSQNKEKIFLIIPVAGQPVSMNLSGVMNRSQGDQSFS